MSRSVGASELPPCVSVLLIFLKSVISWLEVHSVLVHAAVCGCFFYIGVRLDYIYIFFNLSDFFVLARKLLFILRPVILIFPQSFYFIDLTLFVSIYY